MINNLISILDQSGSIVPIKEGKKSIMGWNKYQTQAPILEELNDWISQNHEGYAVIAGYGGFHVIDIDTKNLPKGDSEGFYHQIWDGIPDSLQMKLIVQRTRNNGFHIIYKCSAPTKKENIMVNPENQKPIIETIGPNNYFLIEPSPGYEVISGSFSNVYDISVSDHEFLINHCKEVGEKYFIEHRESNKEKEKVEILLKSKDSISNDFINKSAEYLESTGVDITGNYNEWIKIGYSIVNENGANGRECFHKISGNHPEYNRNKIDEVYDNILKSVRDNGKGEHITGATLRYIMKKNGVELPGNNSKYNKEDKINYTITYIQSMGIRRNLFTNKIEKKTGECITDEDLNSIYIDLLKQDIKISKSDVASIINSDNIEHIDPLREWLKKSETYPCDGVIEELMSSIKLKANDPNKEIFYKKLFLKWLLQIPAMIIDGDSPRLVLVLVGGTYIGKTTFFRRLLPKNLEKYYAESALNRDKDSEILLCEKLLVNADELAGIMNSSKDVERFKYLSSAPSFTIRTPYGKINECFQRKAILCGTSNKIDIIKDHDASNSRIIPLEIEAIIYDQFNRIDKNALFGALAKQYKKLGSEYLRLTQEELKELGNASQDYTEANIEKELILTYFKPAEPAADNFRTSIQICEFLVQNSDLNFTFKRIGQEMKNLGFKNDRKRINGSNPQRGYYVEFINDNEPDNPVKGNEQMFFEN